MEFLCILYNYPGINTKKAAPALFTETASHIRSISVLSPRYSTISVLSPYYGTIFVLSPHYGTISVLSPHYSTICTIPVLYHCPKILIHKRHGNPHRRRLLFIAAVSQIEGIIIKLIVNHYLPAKL